jgi:seryl-tRNA synthetase
MYSTERVIEALRARRELWEPAPGLVGLRGETAALRDVIEREIAAVARALAPEPWHVPAALPLHTLARADYFLSFPQWLTVAGHLGAEDAALERVARAADPADEARAALVASDVALPPAACYHVYAALSGMRLGRAVTVSTACTCFRHEAPSFRPLARDWSFMMREAVCVGGSAEAEDFRRTGETAVVSLATRLGIVAAVVQAEDPFYLPTARGRALLQRVKALKHELVVRPASGPPIAIASFNQHERFFGNAFDIRLLSDGGAASSACVAFGIERWLLAFLLTHGPEPRRWPAVQADTDSAPARERSTETDRALAGAWSHARHA